MDLLEAGDREGAPVTIESAEVVQPFGSPVCGPAHRLRASEAAGCAPGRDPRGRSHAAAVRRVVVGVLTVLFAVVGLGVCATPAMASYSQICTGYAAEQARLRSTTLAWLASRF